MLINKTVPQAWGVKHITFVDNGKVSFSNPVRQNLFNFNDTLNGGCHKATTAAKRLAEICPGLVRNIIVYVNILDILSHIFLNCVSQTTIGHNIHIPMPGHPIGADLKQQESTSTDINNLKSLVEQHDSIFLLTDSRESRWLPTLLGAFYDKVIVYVTIEHN